jgi:ribosome-associated translation inhibitor RaiA
MQIPLQITIRDMEHSDALETHIRDIGVPGSEIVVNRDHAEDVYVALRDAFDAAKRQLEDYARKIRGDVKTHQPKRRPEESDDLTVK